MKNNNKVLSLLGLATKAGKIASGEFSTEKSVKSGKGFLVLVAADASEPQDVHSVLLYQLQETTDNLERLPVQSFHPDPP